MSAPRTSGSAFGSWPGTPPAWRTPIAGDGEYSGHASHIITQVMERQTYPTPAERDWKHGSNPTVRMANGHQVNLSDVVEGVDHWPTPRTQVGRKCAPRPKEPDGHRGNLEEIVYWTDVYPTSSAPGGTTPPTYPTPGAIDADFWRMRSETAANRRSDGHQETLATRIQTAENRPWQTPSVASATGGQTSRSGDRKNELLLTGQAQASSPETPGSLNPEWVAWLMGWARGWEDCARSVTARSLRSWRLRSCIWLRRLGYPAPIEVDDE